MATVLKHRPSTLYQVFKDFHMLLANTCWTRLVDFGEWDGQLHRIRCLIQHGCKQHRAASSLHSSVSGLDIFASRRMGENMSLATKRCRPGWSSKSLMTCFGF